MDEFKRIINAELDPELKEKQREAKQQRGFSTSGTKIISHISKNTIEVYEVESGADYIMDYFTFNRIVEVMGFTDKEIEMANAKILNGYYVIFDFDEPEIIVYDPKTIYKPIGQFITQAKELYEGGKDEDEDYDPTEFRKWYNYINKT